MPVQIIEAIPQYCSAPDAPPRKLRACAYARISLDEDGNNGSIANQIAYFTDFLENNPDFCKTRVYYDDGISGTSTRNRHGFNQMMRDVEADMWDVIYTKSISRYSRNILVTLSSLKTCEDHNCRVFFQKESLWSDDPQTTLLLRILSSMAEAESSSLSANVAMGLRYGFQQGKPMINCNHFLGYDKDPKTGKLVINPTEASTVRFIFRAFLEGFSIPEIRKKLREAHILTGSGKSAWSTDTVRYILSNEKYVGDLLMQKTYCKSFLTHRMVKNEGKLPQYFVQDNHDPVIPRDVWNLTQALLLQRGREAGHPAQRRYPLSGKVVCGCCGTEYKRFANARMMPAADPAAVADQGLAAAEASTVDTALPTAGGGAENSISVASGKVEDRGWGAVWKCKARVSRKDAALTYARHHSTAGAYSISTASSVTPAIAEEEGHRSGSAADEHSGDGSAPESAANRDGLTWRCENSIVSEEKLQMAVDRALALLPREEANIRLIREECLRVLATSSASAVSNSSVSNHSTAGRAAGRSAGADEHSGVESDADRRASAQLLLLHIDTVLSFLSGAGAGGGVGSQRDALPCTTFQQFVERSSATVPSLASESSGGRGDGEAIDLLIERVVIDGEKIRVVFKAGVEV